MLKKSSIQCPSRTTFFKEHFICKCGKLINPNQDVMNRIEEAFEILKAPYYCTSPIATRGSKCGPNPWQQHHHKARDALRSATKGERAFTSIWDRWQNDAIDRNLSLLTSGRTHEADTWTTSCISTSTTMQRNRREKDMRAYFIYEVLTKRNKHLYGRDQGYREAKKLSNLQKVEKRRTSS